MKRVTTSATHDSPSEWLDESDERAFQKLKQMLEEAFAAPSADGVIMTAETIIARNRKG